MKKTLIALLAIAGVSFGEAAEVLWTLDFTEGEYKVTNGVGTFDLKTTWAGTDFTTMPDYVYSDGDKKTGGGEGGNIVSKASEFSAVANVSLTGEWHDNLATITLMQIGEGVKDWSHGLAYDTANHTFSAATGNYALVDGTKKSTEATFTLQAITSITFTMANLTKGQGLASWYVNDTLVASYTMANTDRQSTKNYNHLYVLNSISEHEGAKGGIANVTVYNGVVSVPEPTTATLSLLALAGLAARRRRK